MIGDLAKAVHTDLRARFFPYPVTYGPEIVGHDGFRSAVVFKRDRKAGDELAPPIGATRPRATTTGAEAPFMRKVAGVFMVYARSSKPAASVIDHENECDAVCDAVLTAMYRLLKARRLPLTIVESRLLTRDELRAEADDGTSAADDKSGHRSADWPGCAARVRFTVTTLVRDVTYTGASRALGTVYEFADPTINATTGADED
jgi:hypothetical protein